MVTAAVAGSSAYSQLKTTSSAVNGLPSCQVTPCFSFQVTDLPSAASAAVLAARNRRRPGPARRLPSAIPAGQRLVEHARAVLVLGADREVRIEQGRPLPPQHLEQAAAAALGRLVGRPRCAMATPTWQQLGRHRRRQPHRHHPLHKAAARQPARLHLVRSDHAIHVRSWMPPIQLSKPSLTLPLSCKMRASLPGWEQAGRRPSMRDDGTLPWRRSFSGSIAGRS